MSSKRTPSPTIEPAASLDKPHDPVTGEATPTTLGEQAPITLSPQQQQVRAEFALATTQERIRALGEALSTIEPRRQELAEREQQAVEAADLLARTLAAQPNVVNAAQARLLVVAGTPAEESAQQALAAAREQAERLAREEAEGRSVLAATRVTVAQALAEIDAEAQHAEAERTQLAGLVIHLQREVADAECAHGEELLAAAQARADTLRAEVAAAETRLAAAKAAEADHVTETALVLANYPDPYQQAMQSGLVPRPVTRVEQVVEARLAYLRTCQRVTASGGVEVEGMANLPLWNVLVDLRGLPAALDGRHAMYWPERIQVAETWLATFKQFYRADQR